MPTDGRGVPCNTMQACQPAVSAAAIHAAIHRDQPSETACTAGQSLRASDAELVRGRRRPSTSMVPLAISVIPRVVAGGICQAVASGGLHDPTHSPQVGPSPITQRLPSTAESRARTRASSLFVDANVLEPSLENISLKPRNDTGHSLNSPMLGKPGDEDPVLALLNSRIQACRAHLRLLD
jgi:hypothetical protein